MTAPADEVKERDICVGMTDDQLADLGLDYIAKGWPVLVIKFAKLATKIEKTPTTPHGHHDATLNCSVLIEQIDAARRRLKGIPLGIGAVPGPAGHVTVDYDTKNGARGGDQLERHRATYGDVVDRVSYTSISGAINVILRKPQTLTAIAKTSPWPDVDVLADSGRIVPPGNWCPWGSWDWRSGDLDDLDDAVMPVEMFEELKAAGDTESGPATSAEVE